MTNLTNAKKLVMIGSKVAPVISFADTSANRTKVATTIKGFVGKTTFNTRLGNLKVINGVLKIINVADPKCITGWANTNWAGRVNIMKEMTKTNTPFKEMVYGKDTTSYNFKDEKKVREAWAVILKDKLGTGTVSTAMGKLYIAKSTGLITLSSTVGAGGVKYTRFGKIAWADRVKLIKVVMDI